MRSIFQIHSDDLHQSVRESEYEYFSRLAREHARVERRERRQRMVRKLTRHAPRARRSA